MRHSHIKVHFFFEPYHTLKRKEAWGMNSLTCIALFWYKVNHQLKLVLNSSVKG